MMITEVDPPWLDDSRYLTFLNQGFPNQWDRRSYEWYQRRPFGGKPAHLVVRAEGTRVLAGVAFCPRQLTDGHGRVIEVGLLGAGTTLPQERGRGHYRELLRCLQELGRASGCAALAGFVTRGNTSGRGLARLGAYSIPSFYLMTDGQTSSTFRGRRRPYPLVVDPATLHGKSATTGQAGFHYADRGEWLQQFCERPNPVRMLRASHDAAALVETVGDTDRLQWLSCPEPSKLRAIASLAAASEAAGRRFFMYSMDPLLAQAARRLGFRIREGYFMLLPLAGPLDALAAGAWQVQSGDRL